MLRPADNHRVKRSKHGGCVKNQTPDTGVPEPIIDPAATRRILIPAAAP